MRTSSPATTTLCQCTHGAMAWPRLQLRRRRRRRGDATDAYPSYVQGYVTFSVFFFAGLFRTLSLTQLQIRCHARCQQLLPRRRRHCRRRAFAHARSSHPQLRRRRRRWSAAVGRHSSSRLCCRPLPLSLDEDYGGRNYNSLKVTTTAVTANATMTAPATTTMTTAGSPPTRPQAACTAIHGDDGGHAPHAAARYVTH